jgi:hypothetical protein
MINRSTHTVKIKANTVKGDDQAVHLMAKVDNQKQPQQPQQQPNPPQGVPIGFNPSVLANEINNLTGLVFRTIGNPSDFTNLIGSIMGGAGLPGVNIVTTQQQGTFPQPPQTSQAPQAPHQSPGPQFQPPSQQSQQQQPS